MFWYLINIFLILSARFIALPGKDGLHKAGTGKTVCIVGAVNWVLLSGLRHISVGADTRAYKIAFQYVKSTRWAEIFNQLKLRLIFANTEKDPGFTFAEKIFQCISGNYQLWLLAIACAFIIPMAVWVYKNSSDPCMSFIVFSTLFYSFFALTGLRQTAATAIAFFGGMYFIEKKKPVPFVITVLAASFVHASALILLPLYFFDKIKITRPIMAAYWVLIALSFAFRNQLFNLLKNFTGYGGYTADAAASGGTFMFLLLIMALIYTLFHKQIESGNNPQINMASHSLFVACIFAPLLLVNGACMRVVQYFSIFIMILLPEYRFLFKKNSRAIFSIIVCAVMIALLIKNQPAYHFFWENIQA